MIGALFPDRLTVAMNPADTQGYGNVLTAGQRVFDRYMLRSVAGRGGMGVVWRAWDERLQHDVALKFLPEIILDDPVALKDLQKETKRCLKLTHPHIVRIYDFEMAGGMGAIVMEFVEGKTLAALKGEQGDHHFEAGQLYPLVVQLCDTLTYAHNDAGVVHRDIKPANLMLTEAKSAQGRGFSA